MGAVSFTNQTLKYFGITEQIPMYLHPSKEEVDTLEIGLQECYDTIIKYNPFEEWMLFSERKVKDESVFLGIFIREVAPTRLQIDVRCSSSSGHPWSCGFHLSEKGVSGLSDVLTGDPLPKMKEFEDLISSAIYETKTFLEKKTARNYIEGVSKQRLAYRQKKKKVIEFKGLSHVAPYKQGKVIYDPILDSSIEWTYSFRIAGHWRKIEGVGKNRDGLYRQEGFTWVIPHLRNKGLEHRENIRIYK